MSMTEMPSGNASPPATRLRRGRAGGRRPLAPRRATASSGRSSGTTSIAPRATSVRRCGSFRSSRSCSCSSWLRCCASWTRGSDGGCRDWVSSGAQALYQTTITLTLSFVVFTFGSLLVAIQVAGGQLTPRIIATTLLRDNVVRYSVGLFVFTLVFAIMALNRLDRTVYEIVSLVTAVLAIACMAMFLFLIDYAARLLRPISILARVGDEGASVITAVYPEPASAAPEVEMAFVAPEGRTACRPA